MSKKSQERRKARLEAKGKVPPPSPEALAALKRRRNRRFLFLGLICLSFPVLEFVSYRYRAITISVVNRTKMPLEKLKVTYAGGAFDEKEIQPDGVLTRVIRPDFSFTKDHFSTYPLSIRFSIGDGFNSQIGRAGALDFSATETFTVITTPVEGGVQIQHTTRPGFPLSLVRDLMERLGIR